MIGVLLINTGSPNDLDGVSSYLQEFLSDPDLLDMPKFLKFLLLYGIILPLRTPTVKKRYQTIFYLGGSPLHVHSQSLVKNLQKQLAQLSCNKELKQDYQVVLGMRYGEPTLKSALKRLRELKVKQILAIPLFPHSAKATTGSIKKELDRLIQTEKITIPLKFYERFYEHPDYLQAITKSIARHTQKLTFKPDILILSYHGLPLSHLGATCEMCAKYPIQYLAKADNQALHASTCYLKQCLNTTKLIQQQLANLKIFSNPYLVYRQAFQSKFGFGKWTEPATIDVLKSALKNNLKNVLIISPSFITDCLETLYDLNIDYKKYWFKHKGKNFSFVPCLNAEQSWISALAKMISEA